MSEQNRKRTIILTCPVPDDVSDEELPVVARALREKLKEDYGAEVTVEVRSVFGK